jgi:hypothetical protein
MRVDPDGQCLYVSGLESLAQIHPVPYPNTGRRSGSSSLDFRHLAFAEPGGLLTLNFRVCWLSFQGASRLGMKLIPSFQNYILSGRGMHFWCPKCCSLVGHFDGFYFTYTWAKCLIDSFRMNNELVGRFEQAATLYAETKQDIHKTIADSQYKILGDYATSLKQMNEELKIKVNNLKAFKKKGSSL